MSVDDPAADTRPDTAGAATVRERMALARAKDALLGVRDQRVLAGRYRIEGRLGSGGMADVFEATDPELGRSVAVKFVRLGAQSDEERTRARLVREARALARLTHPNVVPIYDVGTEGDEVYLVMELVRGRTLRTWLLTDRSTHEVLDLLESAGRGLAAAHEAGIVHRDFKPDNVVVGDDGRVRVLDFGLAVGGAAGDDIHSTFGEPSEPVAMDLRLTQTGSALGTPRYMSPEQHSGDISDSRADVFTFFVVLYEALVGTPPYGGNTIVELAALKLQGPPQRPEGLDRRLWRVFVRGLAVHPDNRFADMNAALEALKRARQSRRRLVPVAVGLVGLGAGLTVAAWPAEDDGCISASTGQIATTWHDRRGAVETAVRRTGSSPATATWATTSQALDAYATSWAESYRTLCVAGQRGELDGVQLDRHMRCLQRARGTMDVLLSSFLRRPDETTMHGLVDAVDGLRDPQACERLTPDSPEAYPQPEDPAMTDPVEHARDLLAQARVLGLAGRTDEATPLVEAAELEARTLGWEPLLAEAAAARATLHSHEGKPGPARLALDDAWERAVAHGHDHLALDVALLRLQVDAAHLDDPETTQTWVSRAEAWMQRTSAGPTKRLRLVKAVAGIERQSGHYDRAQSLGHEAVALAREMGDPSLLAASLNTLAVSLTETGRYEDASTAFEEALEIRRARLGEDHPAVALSYNNMGWALVSQGRTAEARPLLEEAVARATRSLGPDHPEVAGYTANLGISYSREGDWEAARRYLGHALEIRERRYGPEHPAVGRSLIDLGASIAMSGDLDAARPMYERAESIFATALGREHPHRGVTLVALGRIEKSTGHEERARTRFEEAMEIFTRSLPAGHPYAVEARTALIDTLLIQKQPDEARAVLAAQRSVLEASTTLPDANAALGLAELLAEHGWDEEAMAMAQQAREIAAHHPESSAELLARVSTWVEEQALRDP